MGLQEEKYPVQVAHNRVWRIYSGGKLLDEFCGAECGSDGFFPEDWLASTVEANNMPREGKPPREGLSICADGSGYLKDVIEAAPELLLGAEHVRRFGKNLGVLVKLLDSAVRLPIQVHPDKKAAKRLFHSDYGKTEAWYILGGRVIDGEEPYILLGFQEGVTPEQWRDCFERQDIAQMEAGLHKIRVRPGDIYLVKGGTPHAIGPGCFLLEIQEPTDYTISVEKKAPDGSPVPDFLCHQGIGFDRMFECFHNETGTLEETKAAFGIHPVCVFQNKDAAYFRLIT